MDTPATNPPTPANGAATKTATLTRKQRDTLFDDAAKGMAPEHKKAARVDPLQPWWSQIKRKLDEGYSARQVVQILAAPGIGVKTSVRSLQRLITEQKKAAAAPVKPQAT